MSLLEDTEQHRVALYDAGCNDRAIATILGTNQGTINRWRHRRGYKAKHGNTPTRTISEADAKRARQECSTMNQFRLDLRVTLVRAHAIIDEYALEPYARVRWTAKQVVQRRHLEAARVEVSKLLTWSMPAPARERLGYIESKLRHALGDEPDEPRNHTERDSR